MPHTQKNLIEKLLYVIYLSDYRKSLNNKNENKTKQKPKNIIQQLLHLGHY